MTRFKFKQCIVVWVLVGTGLLAPMSQKLSDPGLWQHLAMGRLMLHSRTVPASDPFSFQAPGGDWIAGEWLSQVLMYASYRPFGLLGVVLLRSLLVLFTALSLFLFFRRRSGNELYAAAGSTLFTAASLWFDFDIPRLLSCFLLISLLRMLDRWRYGGSVWLVAPLMLVWVNAGLFWIIGLAVLTVVVLEESVLSLVVGKKSRIGHLFLVWAACMGIIYANPVGGRVIGEAAGYVLGSAFGGGHYWTMPPVWGGEGFLWLVPLVMALLVVWGSSRARISEILFAVVAMASLLDTRLAQVGVMLAVPFTASQIRTIAVEGSRNCRVRPELVPLNCVLIIALLPVVWVMFPREIDPFNYIDKARLPVGAVDFIWPGEFKGRDYVVTVGEWEGYLRFRLYPDYKVDAMDMSTSPGRVRPDVAILPRHYRLPVEEGYGQGWRRVYLDKQAVVYVRARDLAHP